MTVVAAIAISVLFLLILIMGALMRQQAKKIRYWKGKYFMTDEALTDALEGKNPDMFLESSGMDVIIREKKVKPKPWEENNDEN